MKTFVPINQFCHDCGRGVHLNERQDIVIDSNGQCRRICGECKAKEKVKQ